MPQNLKRGISPVFFLYKKYRTMSATPHTFSFIYRNKKAEGNYLYSKGLPRSGYLSHTLVFIRYNGKTVARKYQSIIETRNTEGIPKSYLTYNL